MVKIFKANKLICLFLIFTIVFLLFSPTILINSSLNAVSLWANKIFPVLFPMFVLTRIIISLTEDKPNYLSKTFSKIYNTPSCSLSIFLLSVLSGYPMGAKLIQTRLNKGDINSKDALNMLSFSSISGPAFMIGSIGLGTLFSLKAGIIITISNILGTTINGLIFRSKTKVNHSSISSLSPQTLKIGDIVSDSLHSILMVAAFMVICFLLIDILENAHVFSLIGQAINYIFRIDTDVTSSILKGIFEITRGTTDLANTSISLKAKTIIASGLIAFGGFSVMLQTIEMFNTPSITLAKLLTQKLSQSIVTIIICALIVCLI